MKKLLFAVLFLFSTIITFSQWTSNFGNQASDINFTNARGNAVTTDAYGNCYVTGYSYESASLNDIVTIKYTPNGNMEWASSFNGDANQNDEGTGIYVDNSGNVYVVGFAEYNGKGTDVVILKYSSNGTLLWKNLYSSLLNAVAEDKGLAIAADINGNIFITGYTTNSDGLFEMFTRKCDQFGYEKWTKLENGGYNAESKGSAIAVSNAGNIFVTGYITVSGTNTDIALVKYDENGTRQWMKQVNGNYNEEDKAWGIVVDESDNAIITGYVTNGASNTDLYTAKFSSAGDILWSTTGGSGSQNDKAWGIVVDTDGSVYITGETSVNGNINYITVKYSINGTVIWAVPYDGTGGEDKASSIGILLNNDNTKSIIVTGKSWGSSDNFDYATVRYNSESGSLNQVSRYSFTGNSNDLAKDVAITSTKKVIVTGFSQLIVESSLESSFISTVSMDKWSESNELTAVTTNTNPSRFSLYQNYPNPFNPSTTIKFDLAASSDVKLTVYDVLGKVAAVLVNQHLEAGTYNISYSNLSLSSGIYFYELTAGSYREVKKMNLVK